MRAAELSIKLLEHLPEAYVIFRVAQNSPDAAKIVHTNKAFNTLFSEINHEKDHPWNYFSEYLIPSESNFIKMNLNLNGHSELKSRVKKLHNNWFSFEFYRLDDGEDECFYAGRVTDSNEQLDAEQKIKDSNMLLQNVLDNAVDGIITINTGGIVRTFNRAAERLFGYDASEVIGNNVSMLMTNHDAHNHNQYIANYVRSGHGKIIGIGREVFGVKKDGTEFPLDLGVSGTSIDNETVFIGMLRDLTLQKANERNLKEEKEKAIQANNSKSKFLANMSHELRTPMHTIMGFVEILIDKLPKLSEEKQLQFLGQIRDGSERLLALINDLLDLNKLEAGFMSYSYAKVDLVSLVDKSIIELTEYAAENNITLNHLKDRDYRCVCDESRIYQVLINLLGNAIKYSEPGKKVDVSLSDNDHFVTIKVKDHGVGIPDAEHISIFEAFTQSSRTVNSAGGTGLGLAICREIMTAHYGQIWLENNPQGGSIFYLSISKYIQPSTIDKAVD